MAKLLGIAALSLLANLAVAAPESGVTDATDSSSSGWLLRYYTSGGCSSDPTQVTGGSGTGACSNFKNLVTGDNVDVESIEWYGKGFKVIMYQELNCAEYDGQTVDFEGATDFQCYGVPDAFKGPNNVKSYKVVDS